MKTMAVISGWELKDMETLPIDRAIFLVVEYIRNEI